MLQANIHDVKVLITRPIGTDDTSSRPSPADALYPNRIILLKEVDGSRAMDLWIDVDRARTIISHLSQNIPIQPNTYQAMKGLLTLSDTTIERVLIREPPAGGYQGVITVNVGEMQSEINCRPSDALNLALPFNAPIFVSTDLMDGQGFTPDERGHYSWARYIENRPSLAERKGWTWQSILSINLDQLGQTYLERNDTAFLGFGASAQASEFVARFLLGVEVSRGNTDI